MYIFIRDPSDANYDLLWVAVLPLANEVGGISSKVGYKEQSAG